MGKGLKVFTVMAKLEIECDLTIQAESLEDALEKSKGLKPLDFYEPKGSLMDDSLHIKGLFED